MEWMRTLRHHEPQCDVCTRSKCREKVSCEVYLSTPSGWYCFTASSFWVVTIFFQLLEKLLNYGYTKIRYKNTRKDIKGGGARMGRAAPPENRRVKQHHPVEHHPTEREVKNNTTSKKRWDIHLHRPCLCRMGTIVTNVAVGHSVDRPHRPNSHRWTETIAPQHHSKKGDENGCTILFTSNWIWFWNQLTIMSLKFHWITKEKWNLIEFNQH